MAWLKLVGYGCVLCAAFALGVMAVVRLSFAGTGVTVPPVVGLTQDQANFQASRARLKFQVVSEQYDLEAERGKVISQEPSAGTSTRRGRTLTVIVSKGVDRMKMPNLVGSRTDQAQVKVRQGGLKLVGLGYAHDPAPAHTVIAQDPQPDAVVPRDTETSLLVSLGPKPITFVAPSLAGKPLSAARGSLEEYGIQMGAARLVKGVPQPPDTILAQTPAPGAPMTRRDVVQVSVSRP